MLELEALLVPLILCAATLPLVVGVWRGRSRGVGIGAVAGWLALAGALAWASVDYAPAARAGVPVEHRPIEVAADGYVTSSQCRACHPEQYGTWHDSFHRTMTQVATAESMIAPWPEAPEVERFRFEERDYAIQQRGDEYWVEMDDPGWEGGPGGPARTWKQVTMITGAHHWQFFWYETGNSRKVELFPFAYRVVETPRWMPLDGCCVSPPTHRQQAGVEAGVGRWNISCNKCHATHGRPRVRGPEEFDTHVAELGIACEACHGPGEQHVAANRDPRRRYALHLGEEEDETIVNPIDLDHVRASQVCGGCHSVTRFQSDEDRDAWNEAGFRFRPGDVLTDTRGIDLSGDDKFWSDGMIRVSGREYNGLLTSPCYERGEMSCMSCHQLHQAVDDPRSREAWRDDQLKPGMRGNLACTQCHAEYEDPGYLVEHTHHAPDGAGSDCYNCHMPYTTYGLLKGIRTHEVHSPSVAASLATGRPNGCSQCHLDKPLAWAAERMNEWYGTPVPEMGADEREVAAGVLWTLKGDAGQRALMAWSFGWDAAREASGTDWMTPYLTVMLIDDYHAVRYIAQQSLEKQSGFEHLLAAYDFAEPLERRNEITQRMYAAWENGASNPFRRKGRELLVAPDGKLMIDEFGILFNQRDNRPVVLNE